MSEDTTKYGHQADIHAVPNPGSNEALELGCLCPALDNNHGWGSNLRGEGTFWVSAACPIHCKGSVEK